MPLLRMAADPAHQAVYTTFKVPDCAVSDLGRELQRIHRGFRKLVTRKPFKDVPYLRASEVSLPDTGLTHPHLHALFLMPAGADTSDLDELWQSATGLGSPTTHHTMGDESDIRQWTRYLFKPTVELTSANLDDQLFVQTLFRQLRGGHRMFGTGGIKKPKARSYADHGGPLSPLAQSAVRCVWNESRRDYAFTC